MTLGETFTKIYQENAWKSEKSASGHGSSLEATAAIRKVLPSLLTAYGIGSVLDIPCGDFTWWPAMGLGEQIRYIGADIVPELIAENKRTHPLLDFRVLNVVSGHLPKVDLVFCRDCLGHLSNPNVRSALTNIRVSGATYLMATTYYDPKWSTDAEILDGSWRPINLIKQFRLGEPIITVNEGFTKDAAYRDKSLGLWKL